MRVTSEAITTKTCNVTLASQVRSPIINLTVGLAIRTQTCIMSKGDTDRTSWGQPSFLTKNSHEAHHFVTHTPYNLIQHNAFIVRVHVHFWAQSDNEMDDDLLQSYSTSTVSFRKNMIFKSLKYKLIIKYWDS